jgi:phage terminase small subunit
MNRAEWTAKIKQSCEKAGTYQAYFDDVIDTLASILERRDIIEEEWDGEVIVEHTNRSGITNKEQSPALRLVNDLNRDALTYWKELGLTPASLKRINETAMKEKKKESALERALKSLA